LGQRVAEIDGSTTFYYHSDHLSPRLLTDANGNALTQQGHFPFGESWYQSGQGTKWLFTSYPRDNETGNDFASARYYVNRFGRFMTTDVLGGHFAYPQSLNRYAYAQNNPLNIFDPTGLDCVYLNDAGDGVESIDHDSSSSECTSTQGYWADGYIGSSNYVDIFSNNNTALIQSFDQGYQVYAIYAELAIGAF